MKLAITKSSSPNQRVVDSEITEILELPYKELTFVTRSFVWHLHTWQGETDQITLEKFFMLGPYCKARNLRLQWV